MPVCRSGCRTGPPSSPASPTARAVRGPRVQSRPGCHARCVPHRRTRRATGRHDGRRERRSGRTGRSGGVGPGRGRPGRAAPVRAPAGRRLAAHHPGDGACREVAGTLAFVDISGFTALTERLARKGQGRRRGDERHAQRRSFSGAARRSPTRTAPAWSSGAATRSCCCSTGDGHAARAARAAHRMRAALRELGDWTPRPAGYAADVGRASTAGRSTSSSSATRRSTASCWSPARRPAATADDGGARRRRRDRADQRRRPRRCSTGASCVACRDGLGLLPGEPEVPAVARAAAAGHDRAGPRRGAVPPDPCARCAPAPASRAPHDRGRVRAVLRHRRAARARPAPRRSADALDVVVRNVQEAATAHGVTFFETDINARRRQDHAHRRGAAQRAATTRSGCCARPRLVVDRPGALPLRIGVNRGGGVRRRLRAGVPADLLGQGRRHEPRRPGDGARPHRVSCSRPQPCSQARGPVRDRAAGAVHGQGQGEAGRCRQRRAGAARRRARTRTTCPWSAARPRWPSSTRRSAQARSGRGVVVDLVGRARHRQVAPRRRADGAAPTSRRPAGHLRGVRVVDAVLPVPAAAARGGRPAGGCRAGARCSSSLAARVAGRRPRAGPVAAAAGRPAGRRAAGDRGDRWARRALPQGQGRGGRAARPAGGAARPDRAGARRRAPDGRRLGRPADPAGGAAPTARPWLVLVTRREVATGFVPDGRRAGTAAARAHRRRRCARAGRAGHPRRRCSRRTCSRRSPSAPAATRCSCAACSTRPGPAGSARPRRRCGALPDSVEGLVTSQIDRLPPGERALLRYAAVLGVTFAEEHLRADGRREPGCRRAGPACCGWPASSNRRGTGGSGSGTR